MVSGAGSRGFDPHEGPATLWPELGTAQLDGCSPPGCSLMGFFWSERLSWLLLPCTCRRTKGWNWDEGHSCPFSHPTLLRQFQHSPGGALSCCLAAPLALEMEAVLVAQLLERGIQTLPALAVAVEGSNEPSSCL